MQLGEAILTLHVSKMGGGGSCGYLDLSGNKKRILYGSINQHCEIHFCLNDYDYDL